MSASPPTRPPSDAYSGSSLSTRPSKKRASVSQNVSAVDLLRRRHAQTSFKPLVVRVPLQQHPTAWRPLATAAVFAALATAGLPPSVCHLAEACVESCLVDAESDDEVLSQADVESLLSDDDDVVPLCGAGLAPAPAR